jgi:hypothetical protein
MLVSGNPGTKCCGNVLQVVNQSRGYDHCWRESAPRPSTHRGDEYEDGCSHVSRTVAVRGLGKRDGPGTPDAPTARCAATATECSAASHSATTSAACAEHCAGATEHTAERAATRAATRTNAAARAARFIGTAKSATALVSAVTEIPVSLVAAVATAPAIPVIDTGDTRNDAPSSSEAVRAAAVGAFRIDGQ